MKRVKNPFTGIFQDVNEVKLEKEMVNMETAAQDAYAEEKVLEPIILYEEEDETP